MEKVEKNGTIISIILGVGGAVAAVVCDIVPVVSFKGWPAVAQSQLDGEPLLGWQDHGGRSHQWVLPGTSLLLQRKERQ